MNRVRIWRNVLVACAVLLVAELSRGAQNLSVAARTIEHPDTGLGSSWSIAMSSVLAIAPLLLVGRLSNYLRPSTFLTSAAGLSLLGTLGCLLPASIAPLGLVFTGTALALALASVASLIVVAQEINVPRALTLGLWCAMVPIADAVLGVASNYVPVDMWWLVVSGVLVLTLAAFLASILGPPIEPVSTFEQFDLSGAALWLIGISGVIYFLATGASSPSVVAAGVVGLIALAGLVMWIRQQRATGFVPPVLVSRRWLAIGLLGALGLGLVVRLSHMESVAFTWTMHGDQPTNAPVLALWLAAAVFAPITGRLLDRGAGWVVPLCGVLELGAGAVIVNALTQPAAVDSGGAAWNLTPGLALFGAGLGTLTVWLLYVAFDGVPRSLLAPAAGLMVTALLSGRVLGGFVDDAMSGDLAGLGEMVRAAAIPIVFAILGLSALIVVPILIKRWDAQEAARDMETEQESDRH
ncbi:MAG: hypothetical protein ACRDTI_03435 [Mycobacterium sp.]